MRRYGIVGLPNVGKSTLFNLLTNSNVPQEKYPFSTKDHHVGVVEVPDERLGRVAALIGAIDIKPTMIEFVDIAGLIKGAHRGEGLGNKFLSHIREVDCIIEVVRLFRDETIPHTSSRLNPMGDIDTINLELILKDLETIARHKERLKASKERYREEMQVLERIEGCLNDGRLVSSLRFSQEEKECVRRFFLLTAKPFLYVANLDEGDLGKTDNELLREVKGCGHRDKASVVWLSAKLERELALLSKEEREEFCKGMDFGGNGRAALIRESYLLLRLITFFTIEHRRLSAWALKDGTTAKQAAGKIHTDMEKGFISADVISIEQLQEAGSIRTAHKMGFIRQEGGNYIVRDGEILTFRFNVSN